MVEKYKHKETKAPDSIDGTEIIAWSRKITGEAATYVLQRLAEWGKPGEIVQEVKEKFGIELEKWNITRFVSSQNKKSRARRMLMLKMRQKWQEEVKTEPGAHKRNRIRMLQDVYDRALNGEKPDFKAAVMAATQMRMELEGERPQTVVNVGTAPDWTKMSAEERFQDLQKRMQAIKSGEILSN